MTAENRENQPSAYQEWSDRFFNPFMEEQEEVKLIQDGIDLFFQTAEKIDFQPDEYGVSKTIDPSRFMLDHELSTALGANSGIRVFRYNHPFELDTKQTINISFISSIDDGQNRHIMVTQKIDKPSDLFICPGGYFRFSGVGRYHTFNDLNELSNKSIVRLINLVAQEAVEEGSAQLDLKPSLARLFGKEPQNPTA